MNELFTPKLEFVKDEGYIRISGRSVESNIENFWEPLCEEVEKYLVEDPRDITIIFELEYFNTRSAKHILNLLNILKKTIKELDRKLVVKWLYEDSDIKEAGEDYQSIVQFGVWKHIKKKR